MQILITGASSGIGRALAMRFIQNADCQKLIVVARRVALLEELQVLSSKVSVVVADVASATGREEIAAACREVALTHVVHNAGVIEPIAKPDQVTLEAYRQLMATNVEGPFFLTNLLLPMMKPGGRCLYISSGAAYQAWGGIGVYSMSKATVEMMCQVFKEEYQETGVLFTTLRPGGVDTDMLRRACTFPLAVFANKKLVLERMASGEILKPEYSAAFIEWVLCQTSDHDYQNHWNIKEESPSASWTSGVKT